MNIVLITASAPPSAGSHATRISAFIEALTASENSVTLITCHWAEEQKRRSTLYSDMARSCEIISTSGGFFRTAARVAVRTARDGAYSSFLDALRSLARRVLLPDSFVTWIPGATFAAIRAARRRANGESTVIVSSGAPFSAHIVGAVASAITRIPLVLDYGDPWVYEPGFPKRGLRLWLERGIERWVLRCASAVSFTTQATADLYRVKYRDVLPLPIVLPMGFDESDFQIASDTATETCSSGPIRFVYTGRLTREYRSLSTFASFLAHIDSLALTRDDILFEFYGMEQARVEDELSEFVRKGLVIIKESVDHRIFVRTLCDADGVLVFGNNNYIQVPGKIAQCIGARRPILYLPNVEDVDRDPSFEVLKRIIVEGVFVCRNRSEFDVALTFVREKKSIVVNEAAMSELNWNVIGRNLVNVIRLVSDGGKPDKGCGRRNGTERE